MKNSKVLVGSILLLCMACSNVKETPKGFKYTVVRKGDGIPVKPGKFLIMSMVFKDGKDSIWNDSRKKDAPMVVMVQDTAAMKIEDGIDEIFRQLTKGDSITFKTPSLVFSHDLASGSNNDNTSNCTNANLGSIPDPNAG